MLAAALDQFVTLMDRGGVVMWPLLAMSLVALTLSLERCWFFVRINHPARLRRVAAMGAALRRRDPARARELAEADGSLYGQVVTRLLEERPSDATAMDTVSSQRACLERFMPTLSTIITAAPMLGILGTVLGIIASFDALSQAGGRTDPQLVSRGISEALVTTAVGLLVAVITLLPYNAARAQIDRTLSRLESLVSAAMGEPSGPGRPADPAPPSPEGTRLSGR